MFVDTRAGALSEGGDIVQPIGRTDHRRFNCRRSCGTRAGSMPAARARRDHACSSRSARASRISPARSSPSRRNGPRRIRRTLMAFRPAALSGFRDARLRLAAALAGRGVGRALRAARRRQDDDGAALPARRSPGAATARSSCSNPRRLAARAAASRMASPARRERRRDRRLPDAARQPDLGRRPASRW